MPWYEVVWNFEPGGNVEHSLSMTEHLKTSKPQSKTHWIPPPVVARVGRFWRGILLMGV